MHKINIKPPNTRRSLTDRKRWGSSCTMLSSHTRQKLEIEPQTVDWRLDFIAHIHIALYVSHQLSLSRHLLSPSLNLTNTNTGTAPFYFIVRFIPVNINRSLLLWTLNVLIPEKMPYPFHAFFWLQSLLLLFFPPRNVKKCKWCFPFGRLLFSRCSAKATQNNFNERSSVGEEVCADCDCITNFGHQPTSIPFNGTTTWIIHSCVQQMPPWGSRLRTAKTTVCCTFFPYVYLECMFILIDPENCPYYPWIINEGGSRWRSLISADGSEGSQLPPLHSN